MKSIMLSFIELHSIINFLTSSLRSHTETIYI